MLLEHIEKVRQKSENYRAFYALTVAVVFTLIIAGLWIVSLFVTSSDDISNSASVKGASDQADISPVGVVKQEASSIWDSFFGSVKKMPDKNFLGGEYKVKLDNQALSLTKNGESGN